MMWREDEVDALADAIVYAVSYINCRDDDGDETYLKEDADALGNLAYLLRDCSQAEMNALAEAAKRAHAALLAAGDPPDSRWVQDYNRWMEEMFVEGWLGNDRI
jgi:hypothetical protein